MNYLKFLERFTKPSKRRIFFLDRNFISVIKDVNAEKVISADKKDILSKLKEIDRRENIITPILSLFEGEHGRLDSESEIEHIVSKETYHVKNFFIYASVDKSIRRELLPLFKEGKLSSEFQTDISNKIKFLQEVNRYIYQPVSSEERASFRDEIVDLLAAFNIDKCHPISVAVLCALYEDEVCKKILKPKKDINKTNYYNAVMDFQHFSHYSMFSGQMKGVYSRKQGAVIDCIFLTHDKSLTEFFTWFNFNKVNSRINDDFISMNISLSDKGISKIPDELKEIFGIEDSIRNK